MNIDACPLNIDAGMYKPYMYIPHNGSKLLTKSDLLGHENCHHLYAQTGLRTVLCSWTSSCPRQSAVHHDCACPHFCQVTWERKQDSYTMPSIYAAQQQMWTWAETSASRTGNHLFDLLLWSQLVGVSTLLLTAVCGTRVQPGVAPVQHMQGCWRDIVTTLSTHSIIRLSSSHWECHTAKIMQCLLKSEGGYRHVPFNMASGSSQLTARSKVMKGVCCTVDYSPPKHFPWVLRDKLYHLMMHDKQRCIKVQRACCNIVHRSCMYACMLFACRMTERAAIPQTSV